MAKPARRLWVGFVGLLLVTALGWAVFHRLGSFVSRDKQGRPVRDAGPAPVEVSPVEVGSIELRRTFSGTLEARSEFIVAPKVAGRVEHLAVDLADEVSRGQVVAELDNDEFLQAVAQAQADRAVAQANLAEARSSLEIAQRELNRIKTLQERGVASESQTDAAEADRLAKSAAVEVAAAQLARAEASLATANIRLGYTRVVASWTGGDDRRVVAQRFVHEGDTVAPNSALLSIVELHPINAVVFVTEKDYGRLTVGQKAELTTDAFPGQAFLGRITRIAPVFEQTSRQARVELAVENPGHQLKPGMFVRAQIVLDRADDATIVPVAALVTRNGRSGLFIVSEDSRTVAWRDVTAGIRDGERVQVIGEAVAGRVVTLGQQLIGHGSRITIPAPAQGPAR